jgi:DNA repair protein RecO (recombination protein O)
MPVRAAEGTILHVQDYLETSRLYRVVTREEGVLSLLARGVRRGGRRVAVPPDLFSSGIAQLDLKPGRDLHTLREFETVRGRGGLAQSLEAFLAAGAVAEVVLRFVPAEPVPVAYEVLVAGLDALAASPAPEVNAIALATLWQLVGALGFVPSVDQCAVCGVAVPADAPAPFQHRSGGVLCARCAASQPVVGGRAAGSRALPPAERARLAGWVGGGGVPADGGGAPLSAATVRAHQRLLREFLEEHLVERRPLRAFALWERGFDADGAPPGPSGSAADVRHS